MPTSPEKHAKYMRDRYKNDPEFRKRAIKHTQKSKKRYDVEKRELILNFKSKGCVKCGEKEACCLVAHHLDPAKKKFGLGMSYYQSYDSIKLELEKCICLCSNCHMKFHAGVITLQRPAELGNGGNSQLFSVSFFMEFEDRAIGVPDGKAPIFGVFRSSRGKLAAFVVKELRKIPEGVILAYREKITPAEAAKRAAQMLNDYLPISHVTSEEYEKEHDLVDGRVATYRDRGWEHQAIIITITGNKALALFFTSKANWAKKTRRASNDEMAAANFISSRRTYVSLVLRPLDGFIPTFRVVPELLLSELKEEFNEKDAEIYIP